MAVEEDGHRLRRAQFVVEKCLEQIVRLNRSRKRVRYAPIRVRYGDDRWIMSYTELARRFSSPAISGLVSRTFEALGLEKKD